MDHYFLGLAFLNKGFTAEFLDRARSHFDQALDLDPDNIDALFSRARIRRMAQTPAFIKSCLAYCFVAFCLTRSSSARRISRTMSGCEDHSETRSSVVHG
jgi:hypothetical protein